MEEKKITELKIDLSNELREPVVAYGKKKFSIEKFLYKNDQRMKEQKKKIPSPKKA